jgi:hypothetical protein
MGYGCPATRPSLHVVIRAPLCGFSGKNPDQLVVLPEGEIEDAVHSSLDQSLAKA